MTVIAALLYLHGKRIREVAIDEKVDCPHGHRRYFSGTTLDVRFKRAKWL